MSIFTGIFLLGVIGLGESLYLVTTRLRNEKPVCIAGESCHVVLRSKYSRLFGFAHNDELGVLFYICILILSALSMTAIEPGYLWMDGLRIAAALGAIMSLILTFIQWKILKNWCFWCLLSAATNWSIVALIVIQAYRR
ncbi:MAG TPA: vitamin K epoxide reductase family protein [Candidatus Peribacteraceae bacterium]|nr:vitamin K epoxide reductase family protein [Candidatus Peribacteraceae bacterium]